MSIVYGILKLPLVPFLVVTYLLAEVIGACAYWVALTASRVRVVAKQRWKIGWVDGWIDGGMK